MAGPNFAEQISADEQQAFSSLTPDQLSEMGISVESTTEVDVADEAAQAAESGVPEAAAPAAEPPAPAPAADAGPDKALPADDKGAATPMIPKPRFDEVLHDRNAAQEEAAYLKGVIAAMKEQQSAVPAPQDQQAPAVPEKTPMELLREEYIALKTSMEEGEIGTDEYLTAREALDERKLDIMLEEKVKNLVPPGGGIDEMRLDELTVPLYEAHPYAAIISDKDAMYLGRLAMEQAEANGKPYDLSTTAGNYALRKHVAELTDRFGPGLTGKALADLTPTSPMAAQAQEQQGGRSPLAQARADKMELQATLPPDINALGRTAAPGGLTDDAVVKLSQTAPHKLEDLPKGALDRFLQ